MFEPLKFDCSRIFVALVFVVAFFFFFFAFFFFLLFFFFFFFFLLFFFCFFFLILSQRFIKQSSLYTQNFNSFLAKVTPHFMYRWVRGMISNFTAVRAFLRRTASLGRLDIPQYKSMEWLLSQNIFPVSILRKSISGRHRPVRVADGPMMARCRFT